MSILNLSISFTGSHTPQLEESVFNHPLSTDTRHSHRGKGNSYRDTFASFQWTSAVQALCVLLVRYKRLGQSATILGEKGSLASSLDYAITKKPRWLQEMFGCDKRGVPVAPRLFLRANSEMKRQGAVQVTINPHTLPAEHVHITVAGRELHTSEALLELEQKIVSQCHTQNERGASVLPSWPIVLSELLMEEASGSLWRTDIFNRARVRDTFRRIVCNPSFQNITRDTSGLMSAVDASLIASERLGIADELFLRRHLCSDTPIRVACPGSSAGAMLIFWYLKVVKGYHLELDYRFPHAIDISRRVFTHRFEVLPDVCLLGIAPAGTFLARRPKVPYRALMFMPDFSHALVMPLESGKLNTGDFLMLRDDPSTSRFYFEGLQRKGVLSSRRLKLHHREPDEIVSDLSSGSQDVRAILYFPHYQINSRFNNCTVWHDSVSTLRFQESVLFVHHVRCTDKHFLRALNVAIRDAWLTLRQDPALVRCYIDQLVHDFAYRNFMYRSTAMQQVRFPVPFS